MTEAFPEDIIEARAWRIKGVGMYGSDVDVIDIEAYRELAAQQKQTMQTLSRWATSAIAYEKALKEIAAGKLLPNEMSERQFAQKALDETVARICLSS